MKIVKKIYDTSLVKRKQPQNLKTNDGQFFGGPSFSCVIENSYLATYSNVIVTYQGIIIKNLIPQKQFITCYNFDFKHYRFRYTAHILRKHYSKKADTTKKYLLIFDNYSGPNGFAHWISDGLTRLIEINEELKNYVVLMPDYFKKQKLYLQTLSCFDIVETEYIPHNTYLKVKNLFVARQIGESGDFLPENVMKLRKFLWNRLEVEHNKGIGDRIYISRKKASRRFIENEEEVVKTVEEYNFKVIYTEDYSFEEQVSIMYYTKHLVSIHGAALANLHFMKTGGNILELKKQNDTMNCHFYALSDALNINYFYQFCQYTEISKAANNYNLLVDCEELKINLELMLKKE